MLKDFPWSVKFRFLKSYVEGEGCVSLRALVFVAELYALWDTFKKRTVLENEQTDDIAELITTIQQRLRRLASEPEHAHTYEAAHLLGLLPLLGAEGLRLFVKLCTGSRCYVNYDDGLLFAMYQFADLLGKRFVPLLRLLMTHWVMPATCCPSRYMTDDFFHMLKLVEPKLGIHCLAYPVLGLILRRYKRVWQRAQCSFSLPGGFVTSETSVNVGKGDG